MTAYRKDFDQTKYVSFLIKDDKSLEQYNEIWGKINHAIRKEFDSNLVYNKKYFRAKIKSCNGKIHTNFHYNKTPKEDSRFICLLVILIDSFLRVGKSYYPLHILKSFGKAERKQTASDFSGKWYSRVAVVDLSKISRASGILCMLLPNLESFS